MVGLVKSIRVCLPIRLLPSYSIAILGRVRSKLRSRFTAEDEAAAVKSHLIQTIDAAVVGAQFGTPSARSPVSPTTWIGLL